MASSSSHGGNSAHGSSGDALTGQQKAPGSPTQELSAAKNALAKAITIHHKHLGGTLPTTGKAGEASQNEMMSLMQRAYAGLLVVSKAV